MISIVISSADSIQLKRVSNNIAATIGVDFELIAVDNTAGKKGIAEVYNTGIQQAVFDVLCFMHEDIELKTQGWGHTVLQLFNNNPDYGLIGVAGCAYKSVAPSGWNCSGIDAAYTDIIQHFKYQTREAFHYYKNPGEKKLAQVACIDGVWFCTPKRIAAEIKFDAETFKGFHAYDVDFSLAVGLKNKVGVTFDVLLHHFSEGNYDNAWMNDTIKLHKKWNDHLPVNLKPLPAREMLYAEKSTFKYFTDQLVLLQFPMRTAFGMLCLNNRILKLNARLFFKLYYYILLKYLKR